MIMSTETRLQVTKRCLFALGLGSCLAVQAVTPPVINSTAMLPRLTITSEAGVTNQILYSTRLKPTNWVELARIVVPASGHYMFTDTNAPEQSAVFYRVVAFTNAPVTNIPPSGGMALIPAGIFTMGDTVDGSTYPHQVNVSAFYMDTNLVTLTLWQTIYNWATNNGYGFVGSGYGKAANHPVQTINWYDAAKWCNARTDWENHMTGSRLAFCYYTDTNRLVPYKTGLVVLATNNVDWAATGYRLPTEAEWEKASKGNVTGHRFPWGGDTVDYSKANFFGNSLAYPYDKTTTPGYSPAYATGAFPYTSPAGSFAANGYGLRDMAGNVQEWCWDWYDSVYYYSSPASDPLGPNSSTERIPARVLRGGGWSSYAVDLQCAGRWKTKPTDLGYSMGFRSVRAAMLQ